MAIVSTAQDLIDSITEIAAKKSGILLTKSNLVNLAQKHDDMADALEICRTDPRYVLRIRSEELQGLISTLRKNIGNLPDARIPAIVLSDLVKPHATSRLDHYELSMAAQRAVLAASFGREPLTETTYGVECPELAQHGISFKDFAAMQATYRQYDFMLDREMPDCKDWDGTLTLNRLFRTEIAPERSDCYFDQRFIDYLAANEGDLRSIHWRNFERLVTEYYRRSDYHVQLGPGTKDGGLDIRIWSDRASREGPPLIVVQCKRHRSGSVGVETVKAFYADILHEKASTGLIATTTYVTSTGKDIIQARGYNIEVAESSELARMVRRMWKNDPDL